MDKLENYRNEMIRMRDNEICEILIENNIGSQKIINVIEYFKLELESINEVHKEYPILNLISSFGANLFSLILGIIACNLIDKKLIQNGVKIYAIAVLILVFIVIVIIKIYIYFNRKDKYVDQTRKLIIELKRIKLLNRII